MNSFSQWQQPQYIWIVIGFVLLLMEFAIPGVITVFFGIGALLVGVLCWVMPLSLNLQLLIFIFTSVVLLISLRKHFASWYARSSADVNIDFDDFLGHKAVVSMRITPTQVGKIEFRGSYWEAESNVDIAKGAPVEIVDKKNITMIVKPI